MIARKAELEGEQLVPQHVGGPRNHTIRFSTSALLQTSLGGEGNLPGARRTIFLKARGLSLVQKGKFRQAKHPGRRRRQPKQHKEAR